MSIDQQARIIYTALKNNSAAEAKIRQEHADLALLIPTDMNASMRITSATVNGQTFSGQQTMTQGERLLLLSQIVRMFNIGGIPSSEVTPYF